MLGLPGRTVKGGARLIYSRIKSLVLSLLERARTYNTDRLTVLANGFQMKREGIVGASQREDFVRAAGTLQEGV
jgi:hypothetical protein